MRWPDFFVLCLAVGFLFSLLSILSGTVHLPHFHLHSGGTPMNPATIAGFLMWFGAAGYLLSRFADWRLLAILSVASLFGLIGAAIVFWFLTRVLLANERPLNALDSI